MVQRMKRMTPRTENLVMGLIAVVVILSLGTFFNLRRTASIDDRTTNAAKVSKAYSCRFQALMLSVTPATEYEAGLADYYRANPRPNCNPDGSVRD